jgi:hypothetical protein
MFLYMFGLDLIDFDVEKNKKIVPEFKMAAKNCFLSLLFFNIAEFKWKTFFFKYKMATCIEMAFLSF